MTNEIRELDAELLKLYQRLFLIKVSINSLETRRQILKQKYKDEHPYLYKNYNA